MPELSSEYVVVMKMNP